MHMDVPHNDRVYMYTLIHSITLHSIIACMCVCVCVLDELLI